MRPKYFALAFAAVPFAVAATAGGKPTPTPFDPEFGYTYSAGTESELRLANRSGTQSRVIASFPATIIFDLSNREDHLVAYAENNRVYLRSWSIDSTGNLNLSPQSLVYTAPENTLVQGVDFNGDSSRLAVSYSGGGGAGVKQLDLMNPGSYLPGIDLAYAGAVRYTSDGQSLLVLGRPTDLPQTAVYEYSLTDFSRTMRNIPNAPLFFMDSLRQQSDGLLTSSSGTIRWYSGNGQEARSWAGYDPHPSCDNTQVFHGVDTRKGRSIVITPLAGGVSQTWSSDRNILRLDWMPGCR